MVTAFGVFLAPTLLPVLAGLTIRSLTWKGALAGFIFGLVVGFTTFSIKTWYLPTRHDIPVEWANYTFEGISIFLNFAATALGMWFGSVFLKKDRTKRVASPPSFKLSIHLFLPAKFTGKNAIPRGWLWAPPLSPLGFF